VVLDIDKFAFRVDPLKGVTSVTVVVLPADRGAMVAEEHYSGMVALGGVGQQIESRVIVEQEVVRSAVLRADDIWTLDGVTAEENRPIQADNVVVALLGVELDGKTTGVTRFIRELATKGDGRETNEDRGLLSLSREKVRFLGISVRECGRLQHRTTPYGQIGHILGRLEVAEGTASTCMHHSLNDLEAIEGLLLPKTR
jgi:hypothetical protein